MNKIYSCMFSFMLISLVAVGQENGQVSGRILESEQQKALPGATVTIRRIKDSSRIASVLTADDGWFKITNAPINDSLLVEVSYTGYELFRGLLFLKDKRFIMQPVSLQRAFKALEEVTVKATAPLMTIKGDTVEFKASSFKTPPNSMAEDLIKRIPGLTIDADGKLFYNGRAVTKILVDGRPFFSSDGGIALKNIPVDLIDKIQLADTKTFEEELRHEKAKGTDKTLNIKLKEGNNYFGNIGAAAGTDNRYNAFSVASATIGKDRFSATGGLNNINASPGHMSSSGGGGITETVSGWLDYSRPLKNGGEVQASYEFDRPAIYTEKIVSRQQNILNDSILNNHSISNNTGKTLSHLLNINLKNSRGLEYKTEFNSNSIDENSQTLETTADVKNELINKASSNYRSRGNSLGWSNELSYGKAFKDPGESLTVSGGFNYNSKKLNNLNHASTAFYRNGGIDSLAGIYQSINEVSNDKAVNLSASYIGPLGKIYWGVSSRFSGSWANSAKTTWNLDSFGHQINIDSVYSGNFDNTTLTNNTQAHILVGNNRWSFSGTSGIYWQHQQQANHSLQTNISYNFLRPTYYAMLRIGKIKNMTLSISNSYSSPALNQLQPVPDNTNPLFFKLGNPDLKPAITYTNRLEFGEDIAKIVKGVNGFGGSASIGFNPVENKITPAVTYDSLGRQTMKFININGTYSIDQRTGIHHTFNKGSLRSTTGVTLIYSSKHDKQYLNGGLSGMHSNTFTPTLSFAISKLDKISFQLIYTISFTELKYQKNASQRSNYTLHNLYCELNLYLLKLVKWNNKLTYGYNNNIPGELKKSSALWNMRLSFPCLKSRKLEIQLTGFDLLKQSQNLTRSVTPVSITDQQTNNLQQYFMLGIKYHFNKLFKKDNAR